MTFAVNAYYFNSSKNVMFMFLSDASAPHGESRGLSPECPLAHHKGGKDPFVTVLEHLFGKALSRRHSRGYSHGPQTAALRCRGHHSHFAAEKTVDQRGQAVCKVTLLGLQPHGRWCMEKGCCPSRVVKWSSP